MKVAKSTCHSWLTDDEVAEIIDEYQTGSTIQAIANNHDRSYETISKHLRKAGVCTKPGDKQMVVTKISQQQKRLDDTEIQLLIAEYKTGSTVYQLADKFGCHRTTVSECLKAHGVRMRLKRLTEKQINEAVRLYESGLSSANVGQRVGASPRTVVDRLRERGIPIRDAHCPK